MHVTKLIGRAKFMLKSENGYSTEELPIFVIELASVIAQIMTPVPGISERYNVALKL